MLIVKPYSITHGMHLRGIISVKVHRAVKGTVTKDDPSLPLLQVRRRSVLPLFQTQTMRYAEPAFFPPLFVGWGRVARAGTL